MTGNLSSSNLVSCKHITSGFCAVRYSSTCGKRTLSELTFHVASFILLLRNLLLARLSERVVHQLEYGLHLLPLLGIDILDAIDAPASRIDVVLWNVDAQRIGRAFVRFAERPLKIELTFAGQEPVDEHPRGIGVRRLVDERQNRLSRAQTGAFFHPVEHIDG